MIPLFHWPIGEFLLYIVVMKMKLMASSYVGSVRVLRYFSGPWYSNTYLVKKESGGER